MSIQDSRDRLASRRREMQKMRIHVLAGGASAEREVSLASGKAVAAALYACGYRASMLPVGKDNLTFDRAEMEQAAAELPAGAGPGIIPRAQDHTKTELALIPQLHQAGMIFTTMHGTCGEDGVWQGLLELLRVPFVSAKVKGSALAMDKLASKRLFAALKVPTPHYWVQRRGEDCRDQIPAQIKEFVVKPPGEGSSVGIKFVNNDNKGWREIHDLNEQYDPLLIERRVRGRELTAAVIGPCRDEIRLPLVEIRPKREFYDYTAKYTSGQSEYICPAEVDHAAAERVREYAATIYNEFELEPYARIDCILDDAGTPWFLEANTLPGFTPLSLLPMAAKNAGIEFDELLELLMLFALERFEAEGGAP